MRKLWIDDVRVPPDTSWVWVRSSQHAIVNMALHGIPNHIDFDHDLGGSDTAMHVVNWLIDRVLDGIDLLPDRFTFNVHSANPVGAANIRSKMQQLVDYPQGTAYAVDHT